MKLKPVLLESIIGMDMLIVFPLIAIFTNDYFNLPIIRNLLLKNIGYFLLTGGISLFLYCSILFLNTGKGTPVPLVPPKKLVIKGMYSFTRNPMYISYIIMFLSLFLILGHFLLLIYFLISIPIIHFGVILIEEPNLRERFGNVYLKYTEKVPRWFFRK